MYEHDYGTMQRLILAAFTEKGALRRARREIDRDIQVTRKLREHDDVLRHDAQTRNRRVQYPGK